VRQDTLSIAAFAIGAIIGGAVGTATGAVAGTANMLTGRGD
jgi:hypothetical protein